MTEMIEMNGEMTVGTIGKMIGETRQDRTGDNSERLRSKQRQKTTGRLNKHVPFFF